MLGALSNLFFRNPSAGKLYDAIVAVGTNSPTRGFANILRAAGFTALAIVFLARSSRQFAVPRITTLTALALFLSATFHLGPLLPLLAVGVAGTVGIVWTMHQTPRDAVGHRAGWEGGHHPEQQHCENTIEGLADLVRRDQAGLTGDYPYIEFDVQVAWGCARCVAVKHRAHRTAARVSIAAPPFAAPETDCTSGLRPPIPPLQETSDGELVVFHDLWLTRAFPTAGINEPIIRQLEEEGVTFGSASIQDLTSDQLRELHLFGRPGLRVPTLQEFLE
jgi:hypothetical protein